MKIPTTNKAILDLLEKITDVFAVREMPLNNRELLRICGEFQIFDGENDPHYCHEIAEVALNRIIQREYAEAALAAQNPAQICREIIGPLLEKMPTQTWRSREQILRQQFSTPPTIAYLLNYLLNFKCGEKILEPSAGTGSLAVWADGSGLGLTICANEIDERRRELLGALGFSPFAYNAEFINDYLSPEAQIDCVTMNPPFSSSGGRTKNNSSKYGFRHVASALERLKKGGRFGVILGEAAGLDTNTGRDFWETMSNAAEVKAIVKIDGREYYKNGTSVSINLIVGKKREEIFKSDWRKEANQITVVKAETVEQAFEQARRFELRLEK